jgi:hypothetical protein
MRMDDRIPDEVLLLMETSVDEWIDPASDEMVAFRRIMERYRSHVGTASEALFREELAATYMRLVVTPRERLLDRARRGALERCARGMPYSEAA